MKFKVGDRVFKVKRIGKTPYFISSCGEVISNRSKLPRILKGGTNGSGYRQLVGCFNGTREVWRHHHLVMRWFVGTRPQGMVINHKNGIKTDNRLENLEYCTPKQNRDHAIKNRLYSSGSRCSWSKLNEESVLLVRECKKIGLSLSQIARAFNVSKKAIINTLSKKSWKYADEALKK